MESMHFLKQILLKKLVVFFSNWNFWIVRGKRVRRTKENAVLGGLKHTEVVVAVAVQVGPAHRGRPTRLTRLVLGEVEMIARDAIEGAEVRPVRRDELHGDTPTALTVW